MQTTGTILFNARGVNINGYNCFVNLSKDSKDKAITSINSTDHEESPFSGYPILNGIDTTNIKFSPCSYVISNHYSYTINLEGLNTINFNSYTVCFWAKSICFNNSYATSKNWFNSGKVMVRVDGTILGSGPGVPNRYDQIANSANGGISQVLNSIQLDTNWHYYALVVSGTTAYWFIDGVLKITLANNTWNNGKKLVGLRLFTHFSYHYYDDIILIANQALWTSNFTPPTTYLLDSDYAMGLDQLKRKNIIASNVNKKFIIPDEDVLKQY